MESTSYNSINYSTDNTIERVNKMTKKSQNSKNENFKLGM